jgi:hypothetical protein
VGKLSVDVVLSHAVEFKVAHHTIPMLVKLASKGRSDHIREAAFHTLSCILHMASKTVLTQFFRDHKIVSSANNIFARALCSCLTSYSDMFSLRDDIVLRGRHEYSKAKAAKSKHQDESQTEHEFLVKLLSIHDTIIKSEKHDTAENTGKLELEELITDVATEFEESGYTLCMAALKIISQLCVLESDISRVPFKEGQEFMVRLASRDAVSTATVTPCSGPKTAA